MSPYLGLTHFIIILGSNRFFSHFFFSFSELTLTLFKTKTRPVGLVLHTECVLPPLYVLQKQRCVFKLVPHVLS